MQTSSEFVRFKQIFMPGVELLNAQLLSHEFHKHFHETYTIGLTEEGQGNFWCCGETHNACSGNFHVVNPGIVHTGSASSSDGWRFQNVYLDVKIVEKMLAQLDFGSQVQPCFLSPTLTDKSLRKLFRCLTKSLQDDTSRLEIESYLIEFVSRVFAKYTGFSYPAEPPKPEPSATSIIRTYLEAHYAENISIDTLSSLVNLSPHYLIRCFHQQVGLPPHRYQRNWQLIQVKRSLLTTCSLSDIAIEHGFYDQSHLTRYFKRTFGVTPGQYRQSNFVQDT